MLKLSDVEMTAILDAAAPLPVERRDGFLQAVAASLQSYGEIGPGAIHRVFFDPPDLSRSRQPLAALRLSSKVGGDRTRPRPLRAPNPGCPFRCRSQSRKQMPRLRRPAAATAI